MFWAPLGGAVVWQELSISLCVSASRVSELDSKMNGLVPSELRDLTITHNEFNVYCEHHDLLCWSLYSVSTEPSPEHAQGFSLEEKSKTSKKRVHYMKFTKGEATTESVLHHWPDAE